ncbi:unnamed protein product [Cylindrotheca closterium]|uniref:Helicase-associated domain-containing protein n=1 Tax=Cylindrotheca closterium TaxID=2856 RepID=A0AAD2CPV1_9STRA|nr:unnamed protein product [Cylindrotheca closterium]
MIQSNLNFSTSFMNPEQNSAFTALGTSSSCPKSLLAQMQQAVQPSHPPLKKRDFTLSPTNDSEEASQPSKKRRVAVGMGSWWKFGSMPTEIKNLAKQGSVKCKPPSSGSTQVTTMDPRPFPPATIQIRTAMPMSLPNQVSQVLDNSITQFNTAQLEAAQARIAAVTQLAVAPTTPVAPVVERSDHDSVSDTGSGGLKYRQYQAENWSERYESLIIFRKNHGHCLVPNSYPEDVALAQWVKRQRYQYKLKQESKRSTLSDERVEALDNIGFVWDSHRAVWDERFNELLDYKRVNGNCNVPSRYTENRQLAVWVKRQRRQHKFFRTNQPSSMTEERIIRLESIGFEWDLRSRDSS